MRLRASGALAAARVFQSSSLRAPVLAHGIRGMATAPVSADAATAAASPAVKLEVSSDGIALVTFDAPGEKVRARFCVKGV